MDAARIVFKGETFRTFAYKLMFKPFKNIFMVSPNSCGLYIETQLAPQTVYKILLFITFGINYLRVSFSFSVLITFRNLGEERMHGFLLSPLAAPTITSTKEQFINDT
jgi:hypothetical protein